MNRHIILIFFASLIVGIAQIISVEDFETGDFGKLENENPLKLTQSRGIASEEVDYDDNTDSAESVFDSDNFSDTKSHAHAREQDKKMEDLTTEDKKNLSNIIIQLQKDKSNAAPKPDDELPDDDALAHLRTLRPQGEDEDFYRNLCNLPAGFVAPHIHELYCKPSSCLRYSRECSDNSKCCSRLCIKGRCAADANNKGFPGEFCRSPNDCFSNICAPSVKKNEGVCLGDNRTAYCTMNEQPCRDNTNCCSGYCKNNTCKASPKQKLRFGDMCTDHSHCESGYCHPNRLRCE